MNKEEILEKSRHENIFGDEKQRQDKLKSYELSSIFVSIAYIIIFIIGQIKNYDTSQATFIFISLIIGKTVSKLYKKNYINNFEKISYTLVLLGGLILFTTQIIEWIK